MSAIRLASSRSAAVIKTTRSREAWSLRSFSICHLTFLTCYSPLPLGERSGERVRSIGRERRTGSVLFSPGPYPNSLPEGEGVFETSNDKRKLVSQLPQLLLQTRDR